jgi:outer membrane murein-binding lipoprotein Lpp
MEPTAPRSLSFYQLSVGLRMILIFTLIGSCAGASSNSITDRGVSTNDVQQLRSQITSLERDVRQLRREVHRGR